MANKDNPELKCDICGYVAKDAEDLKKHKMEQHNM